MKNIIYTLFALSLALLSFEISAQVYITPTEGATETFNVSGGETFTDPGGPGGDCSANNADPNSGNYPNCGCSTITTLTGISGIEFTEFSVFGNFDYLEIYDGPDLNSPKIFDNRDFPPAATMLADIIAEFGSAQFFSSSGSLTFNFFATTVVNRCGYEATVFAGSGEPCEITCPGSVVVNNDLGECGAFVDIPLPSLVGGCDSTAVAINDYNDSPDASDFYPVGTTTVTYSVPNTVVNCSFDVVVNDTEEPTVNCPSDIVVNLNPGECDRTVSYTVTADDNCPFLVPGNVIFTETAGAPGNFFNVFAGITFDVENVGTDPIIIDGFNVPLDAGGQVANLDVYFTTTATTNVGVQANAAAWTLMGSASVVGNQAVAWDPATFTNVSVGGLQLAPGESKGIYIHLTNYAAGGPRLHYTNGNFTADDGNVAVLSNGYGGTATAFANTFFPRAFVGEVFYSAGGDAEIVQTTGLPSGSVFDLGTVTNCFEVEDIAGNIGTCCFDVTVEEFANPSSTLACNDLVNISVDDNCQALLNADMILEGGPYGCYDDYELEIETQGGVAVSNPIGPQWVGETLVVTVLDPNSPNSCWGYVKIEDKQIPDLLCGDVITLGCTDDLTPGSGFADQALITASLDLDAIEPLAAVACPGGDYAYLRVIDMSTTGVAGTFTPETFTMGVEISTGGVEATLRFYEFEDPSVYDPNAIGFSYDDLVQIGPENTATIPALNLEFWEMDIVDVEIPSGIQYLVWELEVPGGNFVDFVMGGNFNGETTPTYIASDFCGLPEPNTLESVGFDGNWLSYITGEFVSGVPFPLPEDAVVSPSSGNGPFTVTNWDACGAATLTFEDNVQNFQGCDEDFASIVTRSWLAVDGSGNTSECDQVIRVRRGSLNDVDAPENIEFSCTDLEDLELDSNGNPAPSETGVPINPLCETLDATYTDQRFAECGTGFKVFRQWVILDWCTGDLIEFNQVIKVLNDVAPEIICPPNQTVSTNSNSCTRTYFPPAPVFIADECGGVVDYTVTSSAGVVIVELVPGIGEVIRIEGLPVGVHTITYTADDGCGNTAVCSYELTVQDKTAPVAVCDLDTRVSLGIDGNAQVHVSAWDDGSYDNCGIAGMTARRKDGPRACGNSGAFVPVLNFCCSDLDEAIDVQVRVTDIWGNFNDCWITVNVENKVAPTISCPSNVTISCAFEFDFEKAITDPDYAVLGKVATPQTGEEAQIRAIDPADGSPIQYIIDGEAFGACDIDVTVSLFGPEPGCGPVESFVRRYRAFDPSSQYSGTPPFCDQVVTILNNNQFDGDRDITWPNDVPPPAISGCNGQDEPWNDLDVTGEPTFRNANCAQIGVSYQDQLFTVVDEACYKILRTWKVIDWCVHDANAGIGEWTYVQTIKVMDDGAPILVNNEDKTVVDSFSSDCTGFVDIEAEVTDCSPMDVLEDNSNWKIDAFNTGVFDIFSTERRPDNSVRENLRIEENLPFGTHRVQWVINDACGNTTVEEFLLTVVDGKLPTPVCLNGIATVVMPATGEISIPASDFDVASFDNCTSSENLVFSYSEDVDEVSRAWSCEDLEGESEQTFVVNIYVTDEAGNQDFCETYILIQDNNGVCPDTAGGTVIVSGLISNESNEGVEEVTVDLSASYGPFQQYTLTSNDGAFSFDIPMGQEYELRGNRNDNPLNGVTTFDIALIQRHILNTQHLDSPYKLIAADVNDDGQINVVDIAQLRRLILGTYSEFPNNESWKVVVDENLVMSTNVPEHNLVMELGFVNRDMTDNNFVGVKIGDVNGSHQASGVMSSTERSLTEVLELRVEDRSIKSGEQVVVEVTSENIDGVFGYQGTINFDQRSMSFVGHEAGAIALTDANFGFHLLSEGMITTSWNTEEALSTGQDEVLFSLVFEANASGQLSEMLNFTSAQTVAEAYNDRGVMGVDFRFEGGTTDASNFALYQNTPNPFKGETVIGFVLPEATEATITIMDVTGKVVRVIEESYEAGYNERTFDRSEVGAAGIYYYQLSTDNHTATKKMIFMD